MVTLTSPSSAARSLTKKRLKRDGEFVGVDGYVVGIRSLVKKRLRLHFLASGAVAAEVGGNAFADEEATGKAGCGL